MIDLLLTKIYIMLSSLEPDMFFIFPFGDKEELEYKWYNVAQENPIVFLELLTNEQIECLLLWAFGTVLGSVNETTLDDIIRFCKRRKKKKKFQHWLQFFKRNKTCDKYTLLKNFF